MRNTSKIAMSSIALAALIAVPALANSADDPEPETPIVGSSLERATAAAVAHLGDGHVTGTEVGDEESYYEVEVTLDDGSQVDVQLDEDFQVVGTEGDRRGDRDDD
jgi:hypothetical protein